MNSSRRCHRSARVCTLLYLFLIGRLIAPVFAQRTGAGMVDEGKKSLTPQEIFRLVSRSVVVVEVLDRPKGGDVLGRTSGVVIEPDLVVTNRHALVDGSLWRVRQGGTDRMASITWIDPVHDLALLRVPGLNALPLQLRQTASVSVGERVYAIGSPRGLELTLSEGLVSGLREYESGVLIQTSAAISLGSSGGALADVQGRLVGITTFSRSDSQNLNFALSSDWVQSLTNAIHERGHPRQRVIPEHKEIFYTTAIDEANMQTMVFDLRLAKQQPAYNPRDQDHAVSELELMSVMCWGWGWGADGSAVIHPNAEESVDCENNWPSWQRASARMLRLREGILQAQPSRTETEAIFIDGARSAFSDLTDVYCSGQPGGLYVDLEGKIRACPKR
jgi:hypothetical protein